MIPDELKSIFEKIDRRAEQDVIQLCHTPESMGPDPLEDDYSEISWP